MFYSVSQTKKVLVAKKSVWHLVQRQWLIKFFWPMTLTLLVQFYIWVSLFAAAYVQLQSHCLFAVTLLWYAPWLSFVASSGSCVRGWIFVNDSGSNRMRREGYGMNFSSSHENQIHVPALRQKYVKNTLLKFKIV